MPDRIRPELHQAMIEQAMVYFGGDLSPAEAAEFEAHLATCPGCQEVLRLAKENLPQAMALLAFTPKHTVDQQVARFEALAAPKRRAVHADAGTSLRALKLWLGVALGAAAAAAVALALLHHTSTPFPNAVFAPEMPSDAGDDEP